jgi:hypothetical protein
MALWPLRLAVRTTPSHGVNTSSILVGVTMLKQSLSGDWQAARFGKIQAISATDTDGWCGLFARFSSPDIPPASRTTSACRAPS